MKTSKVLIVDDEESTVFGFRQILSREGYVVQAAQSLKEAKEIVSGEHFTAILLDLKLPDGSSLEWIREIHTTMDGVAIIVITGVSDIPTAVTAMHYGAFNFLTKPVDVEDLLINIRNGIEVEELRKRDSIHQRLASKKEEPYFGTSAAIQKVMYYAGVAAANSTVILLQGETGTGKGVLARWIHDHSSQHNEAYVELNCSSLRGELLRSELYGHTKGAFTSAIKDREGLIELAHRGTLFLDEIGDMDLEVQAELLKTIEEKSFRRIGENRMRTSDFRLICASNRNLSEASQKVQFRADLFYRICVFPIEIPSLRSRREDIPVILHNILQNYTYAHLPLDKELIALLKDYSWPGNIRELRNMIERALLLAQGKRLDAAHFPGLEGNPDAAQEPIENWNLDDLEKRHITRTLKFFEGDKNQASAALGISLASLYRKLDKIQQTTPA